MDECNCMHEGMHLPLAWEDDIAILLSQNTWESSRRHFPEQTHGSCRLQSLELCIRLSPLSSQPPLWTHCTSHWTRVDILFPLAPLSQMWTSLRFANKVYLMWQLWSLSHAIWVSMLTRLWYLITELEKESCDQWLVCVLGWEWPEQSTWPGMMDDQDHVASRLLLCLSEHISHHLQETWCAN